MNTSWIQRYTQAQSVLAIALESSRLVVALVRRKNGGTHLVQSFDLPIPSESILMDPVKAGRELAARLHEEKIREQRCVVCLPPGWALTAPVDLPAVSADDLRSFLELRAEREFPLPPSELHLAHSVVRLPDGKNQLTLAAMPAKRFNAVRGLLSAAGRQAASVSLGIDRCLEGSAHHGSINFLPNSSHLDLVICAGGGVAALRSLVGSTPPPGSEGAVNAATLRRELRLTLGRLPDYLRQQVREARCFGSPASTKQLWEWLGDPLRDLGIAALTCAEDPAIRPADHPLGEGQETVFSAATNFLKDQPAVFEFVPPQTSQVEKALTWLKSGRKRRHGLLLTGLLVALAIPLVWRSHQERRLTARWARMEPEVKAMETLQRNIRQFRPWFEQAPQSLQILEGLTAAFPEEGTVWSTSIEVKDDGRVTCSAFARSQTAFMAVLEKLRANPHLTELQVQQVRGDNPIHFTLVFSWQYERHE